MRIVEGAYPDLRNIYINYKIDFLKGSTLTSLRSKYNLSWGTWSKLNNYLSKDLGISTRGGNNTKYFKLWDIKKVRYARNNKPAAKLNKCFYLKYKGIGIKGVGGFIEPITPIIIYDCIEKWDYTK